MSFLRRLGAGAGARGAGAGAGASRFRLASSSLSTVRSMQSAIVRDSQRCAPLSERPFGPRTP